MKIGRSSAFSLRVLSVEATRGTGFLARRCQTRPELACLLSVFPSVSPDTCGLLIRSSPSATSTPSKFPVHSELTEKQSRQFAEPASGAARRGDGQHCISDQTRCVGLPDLGSVAGRPPVVTAGHHPAVVTGWRHPRTPAPFGACLHGNRRRARPFPTSPSRDSA
jgi:hypothetical protein